VTPPGLREDSTDVVEVSFPTDAVCSAPRTQPAGHAASCGSSYPITASPEGGLDRSRGTQRRAFLDDPGGVPNDLQLQRYSL
jgi:hypothetical protein